ncbi:MAG TPA: hypothetical protein VFQ61_19795 [Polyangiaceae bacterium]|nr:hypothetical protein [Polyangiaceae bacterium]
MRTFRGLCGSRLSLAAGLFGFLLSHPVWAGKLDRAGDAARGRSDSSSSSSSSASSSASSDSEGDYSDSSSCCSSSGGQAFGVMFYVLASPWTFPHAIVESGRSENGEQRTRFADYPYAPGSTGYLLEQPEPTVFGAAPVRAPDAQWAAAQLAVESGIGIHDGILRNGVRARLQLPYRLELDADWSVYREADAGVADQAWIGREHLTVRFAEARAVQFRSGLGPQHYCDGEGCVHGVDLTWGFDAFPGRPVVLSAEGAVGNLGQAFAPSLRARLGFMLGPVEIGAGWQQRWIAGIALGGPHVSVGAWF